MDMEQTPKMDGLVSIIDKLSKPLTANDVELRIGTTSQKGFSLLLYKTARTDVKRLNEAVGISWKNNFYYDTKGLLVSVISIYNGMQWIDRCDVGTESFTEKEKGLYSDAFKRAGFKWGIGIELYNAPFIWVNWQMTLYKDKYKPANFYASNLRITEYKVKDGQFTKLTIVYNDKTVYSMTQKPEKTKDINLLRPLLERVSKITNKFELTNWQKKHADEIKQLNSAQQKALQDAIKNLQFKSDNWNKLYDDIVSKVKAGFVDSKDMPAIIKRVTSKDTKLRDCTENQLKLIQTEMNIQAKKQVEETKDE